MSQNCSICCPGKESVGWLPCKKTQGVSKVIRIYPLEGKNCTESYSHKPNKIFKSGTKLWIHWLNIFYLHCIKLKNDARWKLCLKSNNYFDTADLPGLNYCFTPQKISFSHHQCWVLHHKFQWCGAQSNTQMINSIDRMEYIVHIKVKIWWNLC